MHLSYSKLNGDCFGKSLTDEIKAIKRKVSSYSNLSRSQPVCFSEQDGTLTSDSSSASTISQTSSSAQFQPSQSGHTFAAYAFLRGRGFTGQAFRKNSKFAGYLEVTGQALGKIHKNYRT